MQNNGNWNNRKINPRKPTLTQEDKLDIDELDILKKIMTQKKTTLPSLRNQDWKNVKIEAEKWRREELQQMDQRISKLMTMHKALQC